MPEIYQIYNCFELLISEFIEKSDTYFMVKEFCFVAKNCIIYDFMYFESEIGLQSLIFILNDLILYCEKLI